MILISSSTNQPTIITSFLTLQLFYAHSNEALLLITIKLFGCSSEVAYLIIFYILCTSSARVIFICTGQFYKAQTPMQEWHVGVSACGFRHDICQTCLEQNAAMSVNQFVSVGHFPFVKHAQNVGDTFAVLQLKRKKVFFWL